MKRVRLLQHLQRHGCVLKREGGSHSIWRNPVTNEIQAIPRHSEIGENAVRPYHRYGRKIHDLLRWSDWIRAYRATAEFFDHKLAASGERQ